MVSEQEESEESVDDQMESVEESAEEEVKEIGVDEEDKIGEVLSAVLEEKEVIQAQEIGKVMG